MKKIIILALVALFAAPAMAGLILSERTPSPPPGWEWVDDGEETDGLILSE